MPRTLAAHTRAVLFDYLIARATKKKEETREEEVLNSGGELKPSIPTQGLQTHMCWQVDTHVTSVCKKENTWRRSWVLGIKVAGLISSIWGLMLLLMLSAAMSRWIRAGRDRKHSTVTNKPAKKPRSPPSHTKAPHLPLTPPRPCDDAPEKRRKKEPAGTVPGCTEYARLPPPFLRVRLT